MKWPIFAYSLLINAGYQGLHCYLDFVQIPSKYGVIND